MVNVLYLVVATMAANSAARALPQLLTGDSSVGMLNPEVAVAAQPYTQSGKRRDVGTYKILRRMITAMGGPSSQSKRQVQETHAQWAQKVQEVAAKLCPGTAPTTLIQMAQQSDSAALQQACPTIFPQNIEAIVNAFPGQTSI